MFSRFGALPILSILLAGCLQEGPAPSGRHLYHSQDLAAPGFIRVDGEDMIRFVERTALSTTTRGGTSDLWLTSYDGVRQRKVVANMSDYWPERAFGDHRFFMVDERLVPTTGGQARVATLVRLGPTYDEEFRLDGIWQYVPYTIPIAVLLGEPVGDRTCPGFPNLTDDCPQLLYERPALPGQSFPSLYLWDGANEIPIGADSGSFQLQTMGSGNTYFIFESERTLTRLVRPRNTLQLLRPNVSRFMVSGDERYAAIAVTEDGKPKTVVLELETGRQIELGRPNPSGWNGFGNSTFYYSQNAAGADPAELHALDLTTGDDTFDALPSPLVNLAGVYDRPDSDERLLLDSALRGVFTGRGDYTPRREPLTGPLYTPSFTPDGKHLVYIDPAAATLYDPTPQGPLMFQDAELAAPPVMVSPPGLLVGAQNGPSYFFTEGDEGNKVLVFWAHLGRASSDLYFADYANDGTLPTNVRVMARAILNVSISTHSLFGVIEMSQQDGVGDLVYLDFDRGTKTLYARAVSEATERGGPDLSNTYAAYIVRGRAESDRSGLWLTTLAPPAPDGGND
jgi:hypothetical protein